MECIACADCLMAVVNNEFPEDGARADAIRCGIREWYAEGYVLTFGDDELFSWSSCDVCRTPLGGMRVDVFPVAV